MRRETLGHLPLPKHARNVCRHLRDILPLLIIHAVLGGGVRVVGVRLRVLGPEAKPLPLQFVTDYRVAVALQWEGDKDTVSQVLGHKRAHTQTVS